jgi:hypothetical protein
MPDPPSLAERIRAKLEMGLLPVQDSEKTYGRFGTGLPCHGCDDPIGRSQVEFEKVFSGGSAFRFHIGCAGLYEGERRYQGAGGRMRVRAPQRDACIICGQPFGPSELIEYRHSHGISGPVHVACSAAQRRGESN